MELYLMRHGEAIAHGDWEGDDAKRPLSDSGRSNLESAVEFIRKSPFCPEVVLSSPYQRAKDTAALVAQAWPGVKPVVQAELAAGATIKSYRSAMKSVMGRKSTLLVGHMPDLAHFVSSALSDPWLLDDAHMEPGEIWAVETDPRDTEWGRGRMLWKRKLSDWKCL